MADETTASMITDTLQILPLLLALESLKDELTPVPEKPAMEGSRSFKE